MGWEKWKKYINFDTVVVFTIAVIVLYCILTGKKTRRKKKKGKFKYQGLGESGWDFQESKKYFRDVGEYRGKKKKQARRPKLNKHEERCREIFQDIYHKSFKSVRPNWLKNPVTGRNLELDGFCPDIRTPKGMGLAFEYDGQQHSKYNKHFHRSGPNEFKYQVKKDQYKDVRCEQEGVMLVRIPHFVAYEDLQRYITNKLDKLRLLPRQHQRTSFTFTETSRNLFDGSLYQ